MSELYRDVIVRPLRVHEVELLHASMPASGRIIDGKLSHYHATRFRTQEEGDAEYLVAWVGDEAAGHVLVRWRGSHDPYLLTQGVRDPYVEGLAVKTAFQSRGIGHALMLAAEETTRRRQLTTLGLSVGVENARARRLYARLGYRETALGVFEATWTYFDAAGVEHTDGETCTYWVKRLSEAED